MNPRQNTKVPLRRNPSSLVANTNGMWDPHVDAGEKGKDVVGAVEAPQARYVIPDGVLDGVVIGLQRVP